MSSSASTDRLLQVCPSWAVTPKSDLELLMLSGNCLLTPNVGLDSDTKLLVTFLLRSLQTGCGGSVDPGLERWWESYMIPGCIVNSQFLFR